MRLKIKKNNTKSTTMRLSINKTNMKSENVLKEIHNDQNIARKHPQKDLILTKMDTERLLRETNCQQKTHKIQKTDRKSSQSLKITRKRHKTTAKRYKMSTKDTKQPQGGPTKT